MTTATRRRRGGGPRNHVVTRTDLDTVLSVHYPWGTHHGDGAWECSCKATGPDAAAAAEHLQKAARAAFARLSDADAFARAWGSTLDRDAWSVIGLTRPWYGHPGLRRHMTPFYDGFGCLTAQVGWAAVAADLDAGRLTGEHDDLLVLRIAVSLTGIEIPLNLGELWRLPDTGRRNVRDVLMRHLNPDGEN